MTFSDRVISISDAFSWGARFFFGSAAALGFLINTAAGDLIISEFVAVNSGINLTDEDGFPADWIEIQNTGATTISLAGYALTDDPLVPQKWIFPEVSLGPNRFLRVFATGKNRTDNNDFLHTNFSLAAEGEYLALIAPDGFTAVDEFAPAYPPQFKDISYGLASSSPIVETSLLPLGAPLTYLIPTGEIGDTWKTPGFDDSLWTPAASAVGFNYDDRPEAAATLSPNGDVRAMFRSNASIFLRFPFDVVDPAGVVALRLKVKVDDGFVAFLNGTEVASKNRPAGALAFNSSASANEEVVDGTEYEIFDLSVGGNLVGGENILAIQAMNSSSTSNDFIFISELDGDIQDLTAPLLRGFFPTPSPGQINGPPLLDPASEVSFDRVSQTFTENFALTLRVPEPGAVIRYTDNGDEVDENSTIYEGPIPITRSTQIRARAFLPAALPGPSRTEGFVKLAASEANFSSDLPIVVLSTFGEGSPPETNSPTLKDVFMLVYEPDPVTGRATFNRTPAVVTRGGFRKRGSSSAGFPKYGMRLETWDENNDERNINPFDLGSEGDWILNARYTFDLSLMRNAFPYELSNQIGRWAVETQFVELFNDVSGSDVTSTDYFGVYTFMERIDSNNNRLDLSRLDPWENSPEEVTGGYIIKNDRANPGEPPFSMAGLGAVVHVEPNTFEITSPQRSYITGHLNEIYPAVLNSRGINPSTGLHYSDYLDVDSFIDHFWLNTLVMDPDWGRLSQFFYKDRNEKLHAGPVWDYDRTMGSRDSRDDNPRRWAGPGDSSLTWYDSRYPLFGSLFGFNSSHAISTLPDPQLRTSRPDLFQQLIDRWYELRDQGFANAHINQIISDMAAELAEAQQRNFARWSALNPGGISGMNFAEPGLSGWDREVSHLRGWLEARTAWIDEQFLERPTLNENGGVVDPGFELVMTAPEGQIFFTIDGSDPRAPGGEPSLGARAFDGGPVNDILIPEMEAPASYLVPVDNSLGLTWTQPDFDDSSWSTGASGIGFDTPGGELEPGITTNIVGEMFRANTSCYLRFEFDFDNAENINSLLLGMKYDDGFIAYLNGVEVARDLAPANATWNSLATDNRSDSEVIESFVQFDLTGQASAVLNGRNVLAIHGMNSSNRSTDFLCLPTISVNHTVAATPVILDETTFITARAYDGAEWSAPTRTNFVIGGVLANASNLVISEIMYDPAPPTMAEELAGFTADRFFEYLELYNPSAETVDLRSVIFTDGIDFSFANASITALDPGQRVLIVRSIAGFTERYGSAYVDRIAGEFANGTGLAGNGERLIMTGSEGVIADITYDNNPPWPVTPNGDGPSLVLLNGTNDSNSADNWRPSVETLGNPGTGDSVLFVGDPDADLDGDGLTAFAEYAYGTSDTEPNDQPLVGQVDPAGTYSFTFPRHLAADDAVILLQVSSNLSSWVPAVNLLGPAEETHNGNGTLTYTFRTPDPAVATTKLFGRLLVSGR